MCVSLALGQLYDGLRASESTLMAKGNFEQHNRINANLLHKSWDLYLAGLILGLRPANERRRYKVTPSLIVWAQT